MSSIDDALAAELQRLEADGLLRSPRALPKDALVLCSNDYLGYAVESVPLEHAVPAGAGASRLISGDHPMIAEAERDLADWVDAERALTFSSGYAANVGTISALAGSDDVIVSDELNHASIIDGCRLSRARVVVVPHLDQAAMADALASHRDARRRWLVTESYFSMDGDGPDLTALRSCCDQYDAGLIVDEAHALGVFGAEGRGLSHAAGVKPDVLIGTLGKAVGLWGAFVAGSEVVVRSLWNRARSFVFSTGISPLLASLIRRRLARLRGDDAARSRLAELGRHLRAALRDAQAAVAPLSHGPIVPWMVGDAAEAVTMSERLLERGIVVKAIRPPTVPEGAARLRITLHAKLTDSQLARATEALCAHRS
jgi:8-amino-7-oxononanoate synthase